MAKSISTCQNQNKYQCSCWWRNDHSFTIKKNLNLPITCNAKLHVYSQITFGHIPQQIQMILWVRNRKRNKNSNSNKRTNEYGNWIARGVTHYLIVSQIVCSIWLKLLTLQFKGKHFGRRKSHFKRMQFQNKSFFDKMIIVDQSFCKLDAQSTRKEKVKQCWHNYTPNS